MQVRENEYRIACGWAAGCCPEAAMAVGGGKFRGQHDWYRTRTTTIQLHGVFSTAVYLFDILAF
jgi:hypothetical protein